MDAPSIPACKGYEAAVLRDVGDDEVEYSVSVFVDDCGAREDATVLGRIEKGKTVPDALSGKTLMLTKLECQRIYEDYAMGLDEDKADRRAGL